jgi:hypothetical protein
MNTVAVLLITANVLAFIGIWFFERKILDALKRENQLLRWKEQTLPSSEITRPILNILTSMETSPYHWSLDYDKGSPFEPRLTNTKVGLGFKLTPVNRISGYSKNRSTLSWANQAEVDALTVAYKKLRAIKVSEKEEEQRANFILQSVKHRPSGR